MGNGTPEPRPAGDQRVVMDGICDVCSAQPYGRCANCDGKYCVSHWEKHRANNCFPPIETATNEAPISVIARREDFYVEKFSARAETRYRVMAPDGAQEAGLTLSNLKAVWHLLGEAIAAEEPKKT